MWEDPHCQRAAGEAVIARIHGTTVAASPLLPQAPLLPLEEKPCAEPSPPSEQRQLTLFTRRASCVPLTEACELLRREAREVSLELLLQRPACELPPQHLRAQQAASESICAGSEQQVCLSRCFSQFRQPMSIGLGTQNGALPAAAESSERAEKKSKENQTNQRHQMPGLTGNRSHQSRPLKFQVASMYGPQESLPWWTQPYTTTAILRVR